MNEAGHTACLLLGSNIQPEHYLPLAVQQLHGLLVVERVSRAWLTPPVGSDGPCFLNAAMRVRTTLKPQALKEQVLRPLEGRLGRARSADKNAPRTIDVDVVVWDGQVLEPRLWEMAHIAVPVAEVCAEGLTGPGGETLAEAARRLQGTAAMRLRSDLQLGRD